jgi:glycosyltransferase involved in cell wall biosynthesis
MLAEHDLADLPVTQADASSVLRGLRLALLHPHVSMDIALWVVRQSGRSWRHFARGAALVPRCIDLLFAARRCRPDVVHLFWGHYPSIFGHLILRHFPRAVLSLFLGAYDLERAYPGSAVLARRADVVWTHARVNVQTIRGLGVPRDRIRVAHRGIDLDLFRPTHDRPGLAGRLLTAGRLSADKGMDDALSVFARIHKKWPQAVLAVLGDGPERSRLADLARSLTIGEAVCFQGHISHRAVREAMINSDLFLLMSRKRSERLPNVVKEAMASGCVPVVTETPGIGELVKDGRTGFVVPQGDVGAAVKRIQYLLRNPDQAREIAARARQEIFNRYDSQRTMRRYEAEWRRLLNKTARDRAFDRDSSSPFSRTSSPHHPVAQPPVREPSRSRAQGERER